MACNYQVPDHVSIAKRVRDCLVTFPHFQDLRSVARGSRPHIGMTMLLDQPLCRPAPERKLSRKPGRQGSILLASAVHGPVSLPNTSRSSFGQGKLPGQDTEIGEVQLETTRTSRAYRTRLQQALGLLLHWVSFTSWGNTEWWTTATVANQVLVEFIEWQFNSGSKICHSRHAILSVQTAFRGLKGLLGRSWECLQSWQLKLPLQSRRPITETLVNGMFLVGAAQALLMGPKALDFWASAILVRLGFHCLLRPAEICKLVVADLHFPQSLWDPEKCVVRLRDPKNRSSLGRFQFCLVTDRSLVQWLQWFTEGCSPDTRLWAGSQAKFSKMFHKLVRLMGLDRLQLTPGSLRPGGASRAFMEGCSIANLKYLGRWRVEHSLETYIQEAMCQLCSTCLTDDEHSALHQLTVSCSEQLQSSPALHWSVFLSHAAQWRGRRGKQVLQHRSQPISSKSSKP